MYKLENNVEWTNDLKDAFKHNITRAKIVYDNTEINYDNGIKEITLEDSVYVPDVGFIGQATSKKLTLILLDNEQTINLENKEFELYIGADYNNQTYYINYGKFIVNEPPENDSTNGTIKIIAYDYMIKFNKIYQDEVTYPIKLKDYLSNICTQAGVQLGTQSFANDGFFVTDNQFEGKTLREVLKHIGKCAFSWVRIGQDNKLYLDFQNKKTEKYQILDYIQSTGTEYINTGFIPRYDKNMYIKITSMPTDLNKKYCLLSNYKSLNNLSLELTEDNQAKLLYKNGEVEKYFGQVNTEIPQEYLFVYNAGSKTYYASYNEQSISGIFMTTPRNSIVPMYIFTNKNKDFENFSTPLKIYKLEIYIDNVLFREMIPCYRKSDNEVGMYDLVSKKFFGNSGTGAFIKGNIKQGEVILENIDEIFGLDDYKQDGFKKANEYYGPINKVTYADSDIQGQEKSVFDENSIALIGTKELVIYDNFFAYTTQKRQELIQSGNVLFGFNYMPVTQLELTGAIYLDCTDIIQVIDDKNNTITTRVFSHTIKYNGVISDTVSAPALSNNQQTYKNINTPANTNNRIEIVVDRATKKIQSIIFEIGDRSQKQTSITQDLDTIISQVEQMEDLTDIVEGTKSIVLQECVKGSLLELHIYGNNTVFTANSNITVTDEDNNVQTYDLGITEVLRQSGQIKDEYVLKDGNAKVIRRISKQGTVLAEEVIEDLGVYDIQLSEGTNTITIRDYSANLKAKYAIKNDFTDIFATQVQLETKVEQTAEEINSVVARKVDGNQFGTYIRQNYQSVQYAWNQISEYIKFEAENNDAVLNIYDENDYRLMRLSKNGQEFFNTAGNKIGTIGVIRGESQDTLAFAMPVDWQNIDNSKSMAWGVIGPNGNFLPIFYLAGYYGEEQSEYGGELVIEGKLTAQQMHIIDQISFEPTAGLFWDDYKYIKPALVYQSGSFNEWLTYSTTFGHEFFVNGTSVFSMNENDIYMKKPFYIPYGNQGYAFEGYPMVGTNLDYRYACVTADGINLGFYINDHLVTVVSDKRLKKDFANIDDKFLKAIDEIKIQQFKAENRNGLISFGIIAQDLKETFEKYGIKPEDYEILQKIQYRLNEKELYYTIEYNQFLVLKQLATDKKIEELEKKDKQKDEIIKDLLKRIERLENKSL